MKTEGEIMPEAPITPPIIPPLESQAAPKPEASRRKMLSLGLVIGVILLLVVGSAFWWWTKGKQKDEADLDFTTEELEQIEETELQPTSFQDTILYFAAPSPAARGERVTLPITIDTGDNTVSAVQLKLQYDPLVLSQVTIEPGSFFESPTLLQNVIDQDAGTVVFALGSLKPKQGSGGLAVLKATVNPSVQGETMVSFTPETDVAAIGEPGDVLRQAEAVTLQLLP